MMVSLAPPDRVALAVQLRVPFNCEVSDVTSAMIDLQLRRRVVSTVAHGLL